jgi:isopentenyl-diphosphate delta-isomerase
MTPSDLPRGDAFDDRGEPLIELVDKHGRTLGHMPKLAAHEPPGRLHRAVSIFLLDSRGRLLLQRRASSKYHSGGLWSNTCCSHPAPGEDPADASARRVKEELGIDPVGLTEAGTTVYEVTDPVSGLVEREWNHLFVGHAVQTPEPDPLEVEDWASVPLDELAGMGPDRAFTAWFPTVLDAVLPSLGGLLGAQRPRR